MTNLKTVEEVVSQGSQYKDYEVEDLLTQDRQSACDELVRLAKEKAYKPWDHYNDIEGEVEVMKLEDFFTIVKEIYQVKE